MRRGAQSGSEPRGRQTTADRDPPRPVSTRAHQTGTRHEHMPQPCPAIRRSRHRRVVSWYSVRSTGDILVTLITLVTLVMLITTSTSPAQSCLSPVVRLAGNETSAAWETTPSDFNSLVELIGC